MIVFFDIDGTLMNQRQAELHAAERLLRDYGHRLHESLDAEQLCHRWRGLREKYAPAYLHGIISYEEYHRRRIRELFVDGICLDDAECDVRQGAFLEEYRAAWCLYDDVLPCLDALASVRLGILSNGNAAQQRMKLERTGLIDRFSVIIISEEVGFAKSHCGIFQEACRRAGLSHEYCVHLGDRLDADARGSCAAGMRGIWLDRDRGEAPPDVEVIHSLDHFPPRLKDSSRPRIHAGKLN